MSTGQRWGWSVVVLAALMMGGGAIPQAWAADPLATWGTRRVVVTVRDATYGWAMLGSEVTCAFSPDAAEIRSSGEPVGSDPATVRTGSGGAWYRFAISPAAEEDGGAEITFRGVLHAQDGTTRTTLPDTTRVTAGAEDVQVTLSLQPSGS